MAAEIRAEQYYNLNGLFNDRQDAMSVVDRLKNAQFNVDESKIVEAENVSDVIKDHRLSLTKSGALVGAGAGAGFALLVIAGMMVIASIDRSYDTYVMMAAATMFSILMCAGFGAYYATFHKMLNRDSVVLGIRVPKDRLSHAQTILRAGGARFLTLKQ